MNDILYLADGLWHIRIYIILLLRFSEQLLILSSLFPVRKLLYQKCLVDTSQSASNSKDVDSPKFRIAQYNAFYNGLIQQDISECLIVLIKVINAG